MSNQTIAETAIYQQTAQLAEKYKAQRDELLDAANRFVRARNIADRQISRIDLIATIAKTEQSL